MKLSDKTLSILKNFSQINNSIMIREGSTLTTLAPSTAIFSMATVEESFPTEFGIYDLTEFLGVFGLYKESPDLTFEDNKVFFNKGQKRYGHYKKADPSNIEPAPTTKPKQKEVTLTFELSEDDIALITRASAALSLPELSIEANDDRVLINVNDSEDDSSNSFCIDIAENTSGRKFQINFKRESITLLPGSYDVKVSVSEENKKVVYASAHFSHTSIDVEYWMTAEMNSKLL